MERYDKATLKYASGYIYVVGCEGSPLVKIGYSTRNPEGRLKDMQVGSPLILKLLWCKRFPNYKEIEKYLHTVLIKAHHHGEWYFTTVEEVEFILREKEEKPKRETLKELAQFLLRTDAMA